MPPEICLAQRLIERRNLAPPIDVASLLREFAELEVLDMPFDVDGICFDLKSPGRRPRVYVNSDGRIDTRIRFTMAHELGHILIPWHTGLIIDHLSIEGDASKSEYWRLEAEANRFASELLAPSQWATRIFNIYRSPPETVRRIMRRAQVSYHMASLKVLRIAPTGYIFARAVNDQVASSGSSLGTFAACPARGSDLSAPETMYPTATNSWFERIADTLYCWWYFGPATAEEPTPTDLWKSSLATIISDMDLGTREEEKRLWASINGMIALANGRVKDDRNFDTVRQACLDRLVKNSERNAAVWLVMEHELFDAFLDAKTATLIL